MAKTSSSGRKHQRLTLLGKIFGFASAALGLATAFLTYLTVQTGQAKTEAQTAATSAGSSLSSLQTAYSQLKVQNSQLQAELSSAAPSDAATPTLASTSGSVLGTYSFDIDFPYFAPLGAQKPTQDQFNTAGMGDVGTSNPASQPSLVPTSSDKMVSLTGATAPTYQACSTSSRFVDHVSGTSGNEPFSSCCGFVVL